jgi:hypothetical protein
VQDNSQWVMKTVSRILRETGPKAARKFLESRGGAARWEQASREIARQEMASTKAKASLEKATSPLYSEHFYKVFIKVF